MTQDEKIKHKHVLDYWTTKAQLKYFLLEKAKAFASSSDYMATFKSFEKNSKGLVSAIQLNQKMMQKFVDIQEQLAIFNSIFGTA